LKLIVLLKDIFNKEKEFLMLTIRIKLKNLLKRKVFCCCIDFISLILELYKPIDEKYEKLMKNLVDAKNDELISEDEINSLVKKKIAEKQEIYFKVRDEMTCKKRKQQEENLNLILHTENNVSLENLESRISKILKEGTLTATQWTSFLNAVDKTKDK
jgi:hypothetical protein